MQVPTSASTAALNRSRLA